jgi:hypothetical protein
LNIITEIGLKPNGSKKFISEKTPIHALKSIFIGWGAQSNDGLNAAPENYKTQNLEEFYNFEIFDPLHDLIKKDFICNTLKYLFFI